MNRETIIQIAREAGFLTGSYTNGTDEWPFVHPVSESNCLVEITKLIELVRADEREQCAQICDAQGKEWDSDAVITEKNYAAHCAAAIRAQGVE